MSSLTLPCFMARTNQPSPRRRSFYTAALNDGTSAIVKSAQFGATYTPLQKVWPASLIQQVAAASPPLTPREQPLHTDQAEWRHGALQGCAASFTRLPRQAVQCLLLRLKHCHSAVVYRCQLCLESKHGRGHAGCVTESLPLCPHQHWHELSPWSAALLLTMHTTG